MIRHPLAARHALVIAPHPDDEAIGAWALIRRLRDNGASVELVVVSDGGASHPSSRRWPRPRLVKERRRETLRAARTLAISPTRVRFLNLPDGKLEQLADRLDQAIAHALRRRHPPDLIVGPVCDDAHADHRAVAGAIARARRRGERRLGYRVWPYRASRSARGLGIALDGRAMCAKRRVVSGYRTQTGKITDARAGFTMTARLLHAFIRPVERFEILR